jgi:hypothetical protein
LIAKCAARRSRAHNPVRRSVRRAKSRRANLHGFTQDGLLLVAPRVSKEEPRRQRTPVLEPGPLVLPGLAETMHAIAGAIVIGRALLKQALGRAAFEQRQLGFLRQDPGRDLGPNAQVWRRLHSALASEPGLRGHGSPCASLPRDTGTVRAISSTGRSKSVLVRRREAITSY